MCESYLCSKLYSALFFLIHMFILLFGKVFLKLPEEQEHMVDHQEGDVLLVSGRRRQRVLGGAE